MRILSLLSEHQPCPPTEGSSSLGVAAMGCLWSTPVDENSHFTIGVQARKGFPLLVEKKRVLGSTWMEPPCPWLLSVVTTFHTYLHVGYQHPYTYCSHIQKQDFHWGLPIPSLCACGEKKFHLKFCGLASDLFVFKIKHFGRPYFVPRMGTLHMSTCFIFTPPIQWDRNYYCLHFTDEDIEVQRV